MGRVLKVLSKITLPDREAHNSRLFVDLCENIHIHHREFRVVFSLDEYFEYADKIFASTQDVRNYLVQNPDYEEKKYGTTPMVAGGRRRQMKLLQNSPRPNQSKYFPNDFAIELQEESETDEIHVHWRDYRFALPREHFRIIAEQFALAAKNLSDWESHNSYVRKPHRDRRIADLEEERKHLATERSLLKDELHLPPKDLNSQIKNNDSIPDFRKGFSKTLVKGRHVILVGSAPTFDGEITKNGPELLVCVNGSVLGLKSNIVPDITYVNTSISGSLGSAEETLARLKGAVTEHLVLLEGAPKFSRSWVDILLNCRFGSFDFISLESRLLVLRKILGPLSGAIGSHLPSSGFCVLLDLLVAGAAHVHCVGFSLINGHSYLNTTYDRHHIDMDKRVIEFLSKVGKVSGEIATSEGPIPLGRGR